MGSPLAWGEGSKSIVGDYLWPEFEATWPVVSNPNPEIFENPGQSMAPPALGAAWRLICRFEYCDPIVFQCHRAHGALGYQHPGARKDSGLVRFTVLLGIIFLGLRYSSIMRHMLIWAYIGLRNLCLDFFHINGLPWLTSQWGR